MKLQPFAFSLLTALLYCNTYAQKPTDELVKINNHSYNVEEFERVYTKNLDLLKDEEQKRIDNYMDLFVLYKLKVDKAYELGLDKDKNYISEFNQHRSQLAEKYFVDEKAIDKLVEEAYERSKKEINASHILFLVNDYALPTDTLKAYNKAMEVRKEILNGKDFSEAAFEYSEDPSAKANKGELGYFTVFRMVYPFESGAYKTEKGAVSLPVRSQFGYHLIKVNDIREVRSARDVSHIFISKEAHTEEEAQQIADKVYALLKSGTAFEDLAAEYSDDLTNKNEGGKINKYFPNKLAIDSFDDMVYGLTEVNTFSVPFKSQFGWHIVQLDKIYPIPGFEESKSNLINRVKGDARGQIMKKDLQNHLKERFHYKENKTALATAQKYITKDIYTKAFNKPELKKPATIATFADVKITDAQYLDYVNINYDRLLYITPEDALARILYDNFISKELESYYDSRLETDFPEFRNTAQEYREGLLLFDLMEKEVWGKIKKDTLGYTGYYQNHADKYLQKEIVEGTIFTFDKKKAATKYLSYLEKIKKTKDIASVKTPKVEYSAYKGEMELTDSRLPHDFTPKEGSVSLYEKGGKYLVIDIEKHRPQQVMPLEEIRSKVIQDYQELYEQQWLDALKSKADIRINAKVLSELKAKYSQK